MSKINKSLSEAQYRMLVALRCFGVKQREHMLCNIEDFQSSSKFGKDKNGSTQQIFTYKWLFNSISSMARYIGVEVKIVKRKHRNMPNETVYDLEDILVVSTPPYCPHGPVEEPAVAGPWIGDDEHPKIGMAVFSPTSVDIIGQLKLLRAVGDGKHEGSHWDTYEINTSNICALTNQRVSDIIRAAKLLFYFVRVTKNIDDAPAMDPVNSGIMIEIEDKGKYGKQGGTLGISPDQHSVGWVILDADGNTERIETFLKDSASQSLRYDLPKVFDSDYGDVFHEEGRLSYVEEKTGVAFARISGFVNGDRDHKIFFDVPRIVKMVQLAKYETPAVEATWIVWKLSSEQTFSYNGWLANINPSLNNVRNKKTMK